MVWLAGFSLAVGVAASVLDLKSRRIPNELSLTAFVVGVASRSWLFGWSGAGDALLGGLIGFAVFLIFFLLGGMGGGDIKLMAAFGAIIGSEQVVLAAVMAAIVGGVMAICYLAVKKIRRRLSGPAAAETGRPDRKDYIPYAPAISLGVLLSFLTQFEV